MPAPKRRPRGHIRELPSGSFQVIVYAGTDPLTKKDRYIRETLKTYGAAEVALTRLQGQVDQNRQPKSDITLSQAISRARSAGSGLLSVSPIGLPSPSVTSTRDHLRRSAPPSH